MNLNCFLILEIRLFFLKKYGIIDSIFSRYDLFLNLNPLSNIFEIKLFKFNLYSKVEY
jgi:hypothetical protein